MVYKKLWGIRYKYIFPRMYLVDLKNWCDIDAWIFLWQNEMWPCHVTGTGMFPRNFGGLQRGTVTVRHHPLATRDILGIQPYWIPWTLKRLGCGKCWKISRACYKGGIRWSVVNRKSKCIGTGRRILLLYLVIPDLLSTGFTIGLESEIKLSSNKRSITSSRTLPESP